MQHVRRSEQRHDFNRTDGNGIDPATGYGSVRGVLLCASLAMLLAIGSTTGILTWRATSPAIPSASLGRADPAVGYAFYAEVQRLLAGDRTADLRAVVTDDFVDHSVDSGSPRDVSGLSNELATIGATFPGSALAIESVEVFGTNLLVAVAALRSDAGSLAGLDISPVQRAATIEILQTRHGRVSARWATVLPSPSTFTFEGASVSSRSAGAIDANLYRIELPPGGEFGWVSGMQSMVMVESGALSITSQENVKGELQVQQQRIEGGTAAELPGLVRVRLRSDIAGDTTFFLLDTRPFDSTLNWPFERLGGTTSKLIWSSSHTAIQMDEPWRLQIGRMEIPAELAIHLENPAGLETLLVAGDAPVELRIDSGSVFALAASYAVGLVDTPATIAAGKAVQLLGAEGIGVQAGNEHPSTVWVVTIGPVDHAEMSNAMPVKHQQK